MSEVARAVGGRPLPPPPAGSSMALPLQAHPKDTVFYNAFGVEAPLLPMSGSAEGEEQAAL